MTEPETSVVMDLGYLLWRTRGLSWDYEFILEPENLDSDGWYWMHREVFSGCTPSMQSQYISGTYCERDDQTSPFVGAIFLDPSRKDEHSRPVAHYLIWFRADVSAAEILPSTPLAWERSFLEHISNAFYSPEVFEASKENQADTASRSIRAGLMRELKSRAIARKFKLTGTPLSVTACHDVGTIKSPVKEQAPANVSTASKPITPTGDPLVSSKALAAHISSAIASGESWALTHDSNWFGKHFPSIGASHKWLSKMSGKNDQQDLSSRILKSFSGSHEDEFIQSRIPNIHSRFIRSKSNVEPQRGFDALVSCLITSGIGEIVGKLDDLQACEYLARTVAHGAAPEDRFIRNLLLRIRAA